MTNPDIAVQIKLAILFAVGLIAVLTMITFNIRQDHRVALTSTLPLIVVAAFMLMVLIFLALL
ncbi:hypothetical protein [Secundilactobacillus folii]|uniref:Uncharacterized protein n=1 Tax=Secundilactobacillus folii TaxID=2678357 RepID=A0A7X3C224_9LACO|nr:hypothetical protein [Secundilactobacillus folii]MTV81372.1 hypothetical protein [Secundilactobacillus folii]